MRIFGGDKRVHLGAVRRPEEDIYPRSRASKKRHARRGWKRPRFLKAHLARVAEFAEVVKSIPW